MLQQPNAFTFQEYLQDFFTGGQKNLKHQLRFLLETELHVSTLLPSHVHTTPTWISLCAVHECVRCSSTRGSYLVSWMLKQINLRLLITSVALFLAWSINSWRLLGQRYESLNSRLPCLLSFLFSVFLALSVGQAAGMPAWQGDLKWRTHK